MKAHVQAAAAAVLLAAGLMLGGCAGLRFDQPVTGAIATKAPAVGADVPFTLDGGRIYTEVAFRKPDGGVRKALAWVNFGIGGMSLSPALHQGLGGGAVAFDLGDVRVDVGGPAIRETTQDAFAQLGPLPVEAILPAGMWPNFRVVLDYPARTLRLESPSSEPARGIAVPIRVDADTGLISVQAVIDGKVYPLVIDPGAGYTWMRGSDVRAWLPSNPGWYRADGALGAANQAMTGEAVEQMGTVVRVPAIKVGALTLTDVGVLGTGPAHGHRIDRIKDALLWKLWGAGAAEPVVGWLGANALRPYRITVDYANGMSWWELIGEPERGELDAVGIGLVHGTKNYFVGGLIRRNGKSFAPGITVGDKVVAIDGRPAAPMSRGAIQSALRGRPGEMRRLTLERDGATFDVDTPVIASGDLGAD